MSKNNFNTQNNVTSLDTNKNPVKTNKIYNKEMINMEKLNKKQFKNLSKKEGYDLYTTVYTIAEEFKIDLAKAWELFEEAKFDAKKAKAHAKKAKAHAKKAKADAKKAKADAKKAKAHAKKSEADAKKSEARAKKSEARAEKAEARAEKAEARAEKAEADSEKSKAKSEEGQDIVNKITNRINKLTEDAKTYDNMAKKFTSEEKGAYNYQKIHGKEIPYAQKRIAELENKLRNKEGNKDELLAELKISVKDLKQKEELYAAIEQERQTCKTASKRALKEANAIRNGELKEAEDNLRTIKEIMAKY